MSADHSPAERARAIVTASLADVNSPTAFRLAHEDPHPPAAMLAMAKFCALLIRAQALRVGMDPLDLWRQSIEFASQPHTHDPDGTRRDDDGT